MTTMVTRFNNGASIEVKVEDNVLGVPPYWLTAQYNDTSVRFRVSPVHDFFVTGAADIVAILHGDLHNNQATIRVADSGYADAYYGNKLATMVISGHGDAFTVTTCDVDGNRVNWDATRDDLERLYTFMSHIGDDAPEDTIRRELLLVSSDQPDITAGVSYPDPGIHFPTLPIYINTPPQCVTVTYYDNAGHVVTPTAGTDNDTQGRCSVCTYIEADLRVAGRYGSRVDTFLRDAYALLDGDGATSRAELSFPLSNRGLDGIYGTTLRVQRDESKTDTTPRYTVVVENDERDYYLQENTIGRVHTTVITPSVTEDDIHDMLRAIVHLRDNIRSTSVVFGYDTVGVDWNQCDDVDQCPTPDTHSLVMSARDTGVTLCHRDSTQQGWEETVTLPTVLTVPTDTGHVSAPTVAVLDRLVELVSSISDHSYDYVTIDSSTWCGSTVPAITVCRYSQGGCVFYDLELRIGNTVLLTARGMTDYVMSGIRHRLTGMLYTTCFDDVDEFIIHAMK